MSKLNPLYPIPPPQLPQPPTHVIASIPLYPTSIVTPHLSLPPTPYLTPLPSPSSLQQILTLLPAPNPSCPNYPSPLLHSSSTPIPPTQTSSSSTTPSYHHPHQSPTPPSHQHKPPHKLLQRLYIMRPPPGCFSNPLPCIPRDSPHQNTCLPRLPHRHLPNKLHS